ncbi:hypothetical protein GCM10009641_14200 [Mycobacterium cookii]|uniref:Uncharacterized protein n=1 Tax=Mycobacterium cookii TaxID=1775 RepID=A0A7I7L0Y7_9MYCO|nr:hypothetical protein [Mycobacterium cookii]BBX47222.1 hypothetical protein MCOO_32370 [Mycobacterium cookii]
MTQCNTMAAPAPPGTIEPDALATTLGMDDPLVVLALIAEVDAIFCAAEASLCQPPAPPAAGCARCGPRRAGRALHRAARRQHRQPARRVDPMQRSPPRNGKPVELDHRNDQQHMEAR